MLSQTKQLSCELYAQEAVNALRTRLNNGCFPFQYSPRWQPFYANHYNWCLGASEGDKQKEIRIRNRELNNCQYSGCEAYASLAVDQNTHNQNLGCGFSGAAWQSNIRNHYDWCRNETPFSWIKNEALRRNDQLGSC
ncbi:MAG: hypothetical protein QNJ37_19200 [Crocosphaera sp.]|nr:hypothetical protein [Crocosphaera sp.]